MPKTKETSGSRRSRMEAKVGKSVLKEDRAIDRVGRTPARYSDMTFRQKGLSEHDLKDVQVAGKQISRTRRAALGDDPSIGEGEMRGFANAVQKKEGVPHSSDSDVNAYHALHRQTWDEAADTHGFNKK